MKKINVIIVDNDNGNSTRNNNVVCYCPVLCLNCGVEVSSLSMDDIFHFMVAFHIAKNIQTCFFLKEALHAIKN